MNVSFSELYTMDFVLSDIQLYIVAPKEIGYRWEQPDRLNSGFVFSTGGEYRYQYTGDSLTLGENGLLYLPLHGRYSHTYCGGMAQEDFPALGQKPASIVLNFQLSADDGTPLALSNCPLLLPLNGAPYRRSIENLASLSLAPSPQPSEIKARTYALLSELIRALCTQQRQTDRCRALVSAFSLIETTPPASLSVEDLIRVSYLSPTRFRILFRKSTGMSPHEYLVRTTLQTARRLMCVTDLPLAEIAIRLGFDSASYFGKYFRKYAGISPGKWRKSADCVPKEQNGKC